MAAAGGGILLTDVVDLGESVVDKDILEAPIDEKTKGLLLAAVGLLGAVGSIAGVCECANFSAYMSSISPDNQAAVGSIAGVCVVYVCKSYLLLG